MPDVAELGRRVKAKYPQYANIDDAELGRRIKAKYPQYSAFTDIPAQQPGHSDVKNLGLGTEQTTYGQIVPDALSGLEALGSVFTGDIGPAKEIGELALRGAGQLLLGGNPSYAALSQKNREAMARISASRQARRQGDPIYGAVERAYQEVEAEAAKDPSRRGRILRGVGRYATAAARR